MFDDPRAASTSLAPRSCLPSSGQGQLRTSARGQLRSRLLWLFLFILSAHASAQTWELRVCASSDNLPFSDRDERGFENRIAEILAEELGADLTYEWIPAGARNDHRLHLRRGECDVAVGVSDGAEGYLTTIAYYRSFPVFVYRADAPFEVASFDDEILRELKIGVLAGGGLRPEVAALAKRDLMANVVSFPWSGERRSPLAAPLEAVTAGTVDVAVLFGPVGSYFAERQEVSLEIVAAEPKLDLPFLNLVVSMAMGVRPGDDALRDLLSEAIVRRWDQVQEVLAEYDVPLEPLPRPSPSSGDGAARTDEIAEPAFGVGLVVPLPTGEIPLQADGQEQAGALALKGAVMAEEDRGPLSPRAAFEVLIGNAPSPEAARRTAERLVVADGAQALLGGYGRQAQSLAASAKALQVPFLNIGSSSKLLREEFCDGYTFHLEASDDIYLEALAQGISSAGYRRWFVVFPDNSAGRTLATSAREAVERLGGPSQVVGEAAVDGDSQFMEVVRAAEKEEADVLLALLDWRAQLDLAGFVVATGTEAMLTGLPVPVSQTRTFYYSLFRIGSNPLAPRLLRAAIWDASLQLAGAAELNEQYFERWGEPMEPPAWLAYVGVEILHEAARAAQSTHGADLVAFLSDPVVEFDIHKGVEASFDSTAHQLSQPLYLLRLNTEASSREDLLSDLEPREVQTAAGSGPGAAGECH